MADEVNQPATDSVRLPGFGGRLTPAQIALGMNAANRNARRLAEDAKLLLENGRFPTAASIAVLSIEESGKLSVLRGLALAPDQEVRKRAWKGYRSHRSKNTAWIVPDLVAKGVRSLDALRLAADPSGTHTLLLDQVKQLGLYTDCLGPRCWTEPKTAIDEPFAKKLVLIADVMARREAVTSREMELWVEYMQPVYGAPLHEMKAALTRWYAAMREAGLSTQDERDVESFVWGV
ncbi:AbiV family abortive infection protein [Candidatus Palauibacter sp.]|uniref:AbiV family abortive infection protein n=1 Tax=Candidatus Palauibacter sp. TaxID=3101350 RepID=UPI003D0EC462